VDVPDLALTLAVRVTVSTAVLLAIPSIGTTGTPAAHHARTTHLTLHHPSQSSAVLDSVSACDPPGRPVADTLATATASWSECVLSGVELRTHNRLPRTARIIWDGAVWRVLA
jgi:hypothetical protein